MSASETHNQKNVKRTVDESLEGAESLIGMAHDAGLPVDGIVSTAFGCPYEGDVEAERVAATAARLLDHGADSISFGDTTGMATPVRVDALLGELDRLGVDRARIGLHFHNTRGTGLANVLTALERGVRRFDASVGGLGGCPYAPGATGNVVTEDLVHMLDDMGVADRRRPRRARGLRPPGPGPRRPGAPRPGDALRPPARTSGGGVVSTEEVRKHTDRALQGNLEKGREKLAGQHKRFVRERIERLLDADSFVEDGLLANALASDLPADGVVTGVGNVDGRPVCVMANDSTVKAGSWGARTVEKIVRLTETALRLELPVVYLVDSAGARITDQVELFPGRRGAGGSSPTRCGCPAGSRRCAACSGRRPRAVRTSRRSATSCSWSKRTPRCTSARPAWPRRSSARTRRSRRWAAPACTRR